MARQLSVWRVDTSRASPEEVQGASENSTLDSHPATQLVTQPLSHSVSHSATHSVAQTLSHLVSGSLTVISFRTRRHRRIYPERLPKQYKVPLVPFRPGIMWEYLGPPQEKLGIGLRRRFAATTLRSHTWPVSQWRVSFDARSIRWRITYCDATRHTQFFMDNLLIRIHLIIELILLEKPCAIGI